MRHSSFWLKWVLLAGLLGLCPAGLVKAQSPAPLSELPSMPVGSDLPVLPPNPVPENAVPAPAVLPEAASAQKTMATAPPIMGLALDSGFVPSYGSFQYSLFFTPEDIARMKQVLNPVESQRGQSTPDAEANDDFTKLLEHSVTEPSEPPIYPNFHLSSLTYKGPNAWVFWINGSKYTPKILPPDMTVQAISSRSVTLAWSPSYIATAHARWKANEINRSLPKNRIAQQAVDITYQSSPPAFVFTLAPNQSYVGGAFAVYEGRQVEIANTPLSPNVSLILPIQDRDQKQEKSNSVNTNASIPDQTPPSLMPPLPTPPPGAKPADRISLF
jgi:hypothetical protein